MFEQSKFFACVLKKKHICSILQIQKYILYETMVHPSWIAAIFPSCLRIILIESNTSPRRMIVFCRVGSYCFPTRFLIPIHIIVYVTWCVILHATPNAYIPLHTIPELLFPCLIQIQYTLFSVLVHGKLYIENDWGGGDLGDITLSVKPSKASCIDENWITFTSLNLENAVFNCL